MGRGGILKVMIVTGLGIAMIPAAGHAEMLAYDYDGMGGAIADVADGGGLLSVTFCSDCNIGKARSSTHSDGNRLLSWIGGIGRASPVRLSAAMGDASWLTANSRPKPSDKLPAAAGWRNIGIPTPAQEPVAMTLGVSMIDEQNVALDSISQSRALKFPSTRLLAGLRFKLGRTIAE
jgi:hypothetical protein